jgi:Pyridoxamine 5'-phosphate oxidase
MTSEAQSHPADSFLVCTGADCVSGKTNQRRHILAPEHFAGRQNCRKPCPRVEQPRECFDNCSQRMIFQKHFQFASPFLILATGGSQGLDCSPKGDKPGFVQVKDDGRTSLIPDRRGNNRIDSIKNVVEDPRVALIFLVPGANETYRVNGRAQVSIDPS